MKKVIAFLLAIASLATTAFAAVPDWKQAERGETKQETDWEQAERPLPKWYDDLDADCAYIIWYLDNHGLTLKAACGIAANIFHESSFDPEAVSSDGASYGLCQWVGSRKKALKEMDDYTSIDTQLDYMLGELAADYTMVNLDGDAYDVAYSFCIWYEAPPAGKSAARVRAATAEEWWCILENAE